MASRIPTKSVRRGGYWGERTEGYSVQGTYPGVVCVRHEVVSLRPPGAGLRVASMLTEYATAIEAAGFDVVRESDRLTVAARPEEG